LSLKIKFFLNKFKMFLKNFSFIIKSRIEVRDFLIMKTVIYKKICENKPITCK